MSLLLVATSSAHEGSKGGNSDLDPPASPAATPAHNSLIEPSGANGPTRGVGPAFRKGVSFAGGDPWPSMHHAHGQLISTLPADGPFAGLRA
jgi:hypothetical protein